MTSNIGFIKVALLDQIPQSIFDITVGGEMLERFGNDFLRSSHV